MRVAGLAACVLMTACVETQFGTGGNGGGSTECDCNDENPCTLDLCDADGSCEHPAATVVTLAQPTGDCQKAVCDGTTLSSEEDASDIPSDDGNPCTNGVCSDGSPQHEQSADGSPCNGGTCADGICSSCFEDSDCATDTFCADFSCVDNGCEVEFRSDGTIDPSALDVTGDCLAFQCVEGQLAAMELPLETDADDDNQCTMDSCDGSMPLHLPVNPGSPCGSGNQCNSDGACLDCVNDAGCAGVNDQCIAGNVCADCDATGGCVGSLVCNVATHLCVECLVNEDCPGTQICEANTCD